MDYKLKTISKESEEAIAAGGRQGTRRGGGGGGWRTEVAVDAPSGFLLNAFKKMWPLIREEKVRVIWALVAILINSGLTLLGPLVVGYTIDQYIQTHNLHGLFVYSGILLGIYLLAFVANFIQMRTMGAVGQRTLFRLRNAVFNKLQELPVAFFNQNRAGDLISRINNDTNRLNQLFSQTLMQFTGNVFVIIGAAIFVLAINWKLGLAALLPAVGILLFTTLSSSWMKRINLVSLQAEGAMSGQIQEGLDNFKVVLAFNRRDYFRERFSQVNYVNFSTSVKAGVVNNILSPLYDFAGNLGQLIVLAYGIYLILHGQFAIGLLVGFLLYVSRFYDPLRQMAQLWATVQVSMAGWDRVSEILALESDLKTMPMPTMPVGKAANFMKKKAAGRPGAAPAPGAETSTLIEFRDVCFSYPGGKEVLHHIDFAFERGKTYALVGPTGGGKTTTASLVARLYDPTEGRVLFDGRDIRTYTPEERSAKIGFILQEPFLFSGTVRDNILYGNPKYVGHSNDELLVLLKQANLDGLLARFEKGLDTEITASSDAISLGQRQLIAFMRAVLRQPELLILDEATANIDTVTEQLLEQILHKLPPSTTRVIIAHRLNTIESADQIYFVNAGQVTHAGSFQHAMDMLLHGKRQS